MAMFPASYLGHIKFGPQTIARFWACIRLLSLESITLKTNTKSIMVSGPVLTHASFEG